MKIRRTTAGELLIGIIEPALGIRKEEIVWLGKSQLISRFGIEGSQILVKKAQEGVYSVAYKQALKETKDG